MSERYRWSANGAGGEELLHLQRGAGAASIIFALPPFEETNRTRAFAATIARKLNTQGFTIAIPDLPGTGESLLPTEAARLDHWRAGFAAAAAALSGTVHSVSVRAGTLLDLDAKVTSRWRLSPQDGASLARELERQRKLGDGFIGGNAVSEALLAALPGTESSTGGAVRVVRLAGENLSADRVVDAAPLWRRAEPDNDPALAALLADDIAEWIAACGN